MNAPARADERPARGRIDSEGRLIDADPVLAALHRRAGGREGGTLAVPQIASIARLAKRLNIVINRSVIAADGERDLDLWVRAEPAPSHVDLSVGGWTERPSLVANDKASVGRTADFIRASADWMWETDESLRFTALSPAAAAAIGRSPAELVGRQLTRLFRFQEGEDGGLPILVALAEQRRFDDQLAELRSEGKDRYRLSGVPLIDGTGRFAGFRGSASSLPKWLPNAASETEAAVEHAASSGFGERLDRALRDPLAKIIANAETIESQPEGPLRRDYANYAHDIASAGRHLLALVGDLVDLQAIERPDYRPTAEPLDLAELARRAAGLVSAHAAERNVIIDVPPAGEVVPAVGEERRALQVLVNLLSNAVRYSPENGQIWVRAEVAPGYASVAVADQGRGISDADQKRIFDKFERLDPSEPGGSGLGLYISRRLAQAMSGDLRVNSAPGQGARFTFTLPR